MTKTAVAILAASLLWLGEARAGTINYGTSEYTLDVLALLVDAETRVAVAADTFGVPGDSDTAPDSLSLATSLPGGLSAEFDLTNQFFEGDSFSIEMSAQASGSKAENIWAFVDVRNLVFFAFSIESGTDEMAILEYAFDSSLTGVFGQRGSGVLSLAEGAIDGPPLDGGSGTSIQSFHMVDLGSSEAGSFQLKTNKTYSLVFDYTLLARPGLDDTAFGDTSGSLSAHVQLATVAVPEPATGSLLGLGLAALASCRRARPNERA